MSISDFQPNRLVKGAAAAVGVALTVALGALVGSGSTSAGRISVDEVREGFNSALECMEENGAEVVQSSFTVVGGHVYTEHDAIDPNSKLDGSPDVSDECMLTHYGPVLQRYASQHARTAAETEALQEKIRDCMEESGVSLPKVMDDFSMDSMKIDPGVFGTCSASARRQADG